MKVKDLKKILRKYPKNAVVVVDGTPIANISGTCSNLGVWTVIIKVKK